MQQRCLENFQDPLEDIMTISVKDHCCNFRMTKSERCQATATLFGPLAACALLQQTSQGPGGEGAKAEENTKGTKVKRMGPSRMRQILTSCTRTGAGGQSVRGDASRSGSVTVQCPTSAARPLSRWREAVTVIAVVGKTFTLSERRRCGEKPRTS